MKKYRFVGTTMEVGDKRLTRLGDSIMLDDDMGAPLLTEDAFASVGFTPEELKIFATPGQRVEMPSDFAAKLSTAWALVGKKATPGKPKEEK